MIHSMNDEGDSLNFHNNNGHFSDVPQSLMALLKPREALKERLELELS
jgi:hypothetical protein